MAYLPDTKKQKGQSEEQEQPLIEQPEPAMLAGGGGTRRSTGTGGRSSPWTNIQAYLNANKGTEGSSGILNESVGGALSKESGALKQAATEASSKAKGEAEKTNISTSKADQLIKEATQGQKAGIGQIQSALGAKYEGPQDFNYVAGQEAQNYLDVGTDPGFNRVLSTLYGQRGLGTGQRALQSQLDIMNPQVQAAKQQLGTQAVGLQGELGSLIPQTQQDVVAAQGAFRTQQEGLRDYLTSQQAAKRASIDKAVNDFNAAITDTERRAAAGPQGVETRRYTTMTPTIYRGRNPFEDTEETQGDARYQEKEFQLSADPFRKYTPGVRATAGNLAEIAPQRDEYNAIMEALGRGGEVIAPEETQALGADYSFNPSDWENAWAALTKGWNRG